MFKVYNNKQTCFKCATKEENEKCSYTQQCINCKKNKNVNTNHSANDKSCPIFLREKETQAIVTLKKTGRQNAIKKYNERTNPNINNSKNNKVEKLAGSCSSYLSNVNNSSLFDNEILQLDKPTTSSLVTDMF